MRNPKACLLSVCAVSTFAVASGSGEAWAQSAEVTPSSLTKASDRESYAEPAEIIVTAQRRSENLRDVPLSISAISSTRLQDSGVSDTLALTRITPGLQIDRVGSNTLPALRGVTTQLTAPGSDSNVAIYLDGVYQPSLGANTFDLPDVERIEVLKGPQGTLFGRNATGGAIQIFTRKPEFEWGGKIIASYGNYDDKNVSGFVTGPIVNDLIAVSGTGSFRQNDGYFTDLRTGERIGGLNSKLVRSKLLITPMDTVSVELAGFYLERHDSSISYGSVLNGNTIARFDPDAVIPIRPRDAASNNPLRRSNWNYGFSGKVDVDLDFGKITSITAYGRFKAQGNTDGDYSYQPNGGDVFYDSHSTEHSFTQEVSLASSLSGPLNFVVGAFYVNGDGSWDPLNVTSPTTRVAIYGTQDIEAAAGFGELYYDVTDRLSLIGGLRYSWEKRSLESAATGIGLPEPDLVFRGEKSWNSLTPRVSVKYKVATDANLYFTYSQGFKSGVYNTTALRLNADGSQPLVDPEKIRAYELGYKARLAPGINFSLAGYHYDYKDVQVNAFQNVNGTPLSIAQNAASARINGAEFELNAQLGSHWDVQLGGAWLDAEYKKFPDASVAVPRTDANGVPTNTGNVSTPQDVSGKKMIRAPEFTVTGSVTYSQDLAGGSFRANTSTYYSSRIYYTFDNRVSQSPYATVDARVSWSPHDSGLTIAAFGRNLTGTDYFQGVFITELSDAVTYAPPRTYGVEATFEF